MNWIAGYWWIWLAGVVVILAVIVVRSVTNTLGMAADVATIVSKCRDVMHLPEGERRKHITKIGVEIGSEKIKSRMVNYLITIVLAFFGGGFGILLILAIIQHVTLYVRHGT